MSKRTPWVQIKSEYLLGVTPKDLAEKYGLDPKTIHEKASKENWTEEKARICKNLQVHTQEQVQRITLLALRRLEDVLTEDMIKTSDLVSAIGKALDISGLKTENKNLKGDAKNPLMVQKVFVTPEEYDEVQKHIEDFISND